MSERARARMGRLVLMGWAVLAFSLVVAPPQPSAATEPLPLPTGEVVLTIEGSMARSNANGAALFDMAMLKAMPHTEFTTGTVWTEGVSTYTGVLLRDLLESLGAEGSRIVASAIDGYQAVIPTDELHADGPIVAFLRDGVPMSVRNRGPLWVIYPYDDNPAFRNDTTYARSIWQLTLIEVEG